MPLFLSLCCDHCCFPHPFIERHLSFSPVSTVRNSAFLRDPFCLLSLPSRGDRALACAQGLPWHLSVPDFSLLTDENRTSFFKCAHCAILPCLWPALKVFGLLSLLGCPFQCFFSFFSLFYSSGGVLRRFPWFLNRPTPFSINSFLGHGPSAFPVSVEES